MIQSRLVYGTIIEDYDKIEVIKEILQNPAFEDMELKYSGNLNEDIEDPIPVLYYRNYIAVGEFQDDFVYIVRSINLEETLSPEERLKTSEKIRQIYDLTGIQHLAVRPEWILMISDEDL